MSLVILGRSPMVEDILIREKHFSRVINRNTDEPDNGELWTDSYISCIGSPRSYLTKVQTLEGLTIKGKWTNLDLSYTNTKFKHGVGIGMGYDNLFFPFVYISPSVQIGNHCLVMPNVTIHHDCELGDGTNIASGVTVNGCVKIGGSCFIGAGSVLKEGITVCKNVLIGACSYVNRDIVEPGIYFGSPAIKQ